MQTACVPLCYQLFLHVHVNLGPGSFFNFWAIKVYYGDSELENLRVAHIETYRMITDPFFVFYRLAVLN